MPINSVPTVSPASMKIASKGSKGATQLTMLAFAKSNQLRNMPPSPVQDEPTFSAVSAAEFSDRTAEQATPAELPAEKVTDSAYSDRPIDPVPAPTYKRPSAVSSDPHCATPFHLPACLEDRAQLAGPTSDVHGVVH